MATFDLIWFLLLLKLGFLFYLFIKKEIKIKQIFFYKNSIYEISFINKTLEITSGKFLPCCVSCEIK